MEACARRFGYGFSHAGELDCPRKSGGAASGSSRGLRQAQLNSLAEELGSEPIVMLDDPGRIHIRGM